MLPSTRGRVAAMSMLTLERSLAEAGSAPLARRHAFTGGGAFLALAAVLMLAAPASTTAATRLTGKVIDAETQRPIAGAKVELANAAGGAGFHRDRTSGNGDFALERVATDRSYTLSVSADGYADFVLGWWQMPAAQRSADVVIPLDRAGSILVKITRGDGKTPIASARVVARTETPSPWWTGARDEPAQAFSDRDGVVRFRDLKAGFWTIEAEAGGAIAAQARRVAVRRGEETAVTLELPRPASLAGVVRLADGTAVADVAVVARGAAEAVGTTGPDGGFAITGLKPGKYRVEVQHEGFQPAASRETYALEEGGSRDGIELTVTPRPLELGFVLPREVFAADERAELALRSFRLGQIVLTLWRIPTARLLDPARDFRALAQGPDTSSLERVVAWTHATAEGPPHAWREEMLRLDRDLPPGAYLLHGQGGEVERRQIFFVSDLSLLVKRSPARILVSAASLRTGVPVEGASVTWMPVPEAGAVQSGAGWSQAIVGGHAAGVTDSSGLMMASLTGHDRPVRVIAVSERHGVAVAESPLGGPVDRAIDQVYLYTERPVYRPGQTVFWKAFARRATDTGYAPPRGGAVSLELRGPDGATVDVPTDTLTDRGSADGAISLPNDLPLGDYALTASVERGAATAAFAIQEYRKPEFRVEVTPDRAVVTSGDEIRFTIAATYFFGAPVFGAAVRYNLFESRLSRDEERFDDGFSAGETPEMGYGRVLETGEARTDVDGRLALAFTPARVSYDRRLTLEIEVIDPANRSVRGRGSVIMGRGLFVVTVRPTRRMVPVGQPVVVEVKTEDHAGRPLSAAVTVALEQDAWNPIERRFTRATRALATATVTTDSAGRARVSLTPEPVRSGSLTIRARAEDARGNRIADETTVWVHDPKVWQYAYRYPSLEAFADRERYQPGDTARIVINTDVAYAAVLATLEGRDLEQHQVVHLFGNTGTVSFPILPGHAPNVYVALHVRKGKEIVSRVLDLSVAAERHDLDIRLILDRAEYRPQDEARVRVETRVAGGQPVAAEVSLGVVDEAIYSIRPDRTPKPHDVFYGHRPNWVTTVVSFPALYLGGASKGDADQVRGDFRDVAFWAPTISTDATGRAEVAFRFPDNLTTWRLTSRGATADTKVGERVASVLVTKDLVARIAPPRFLTSGDQAALVTVVTNRSERPQPQVEESFEARGAAENRGERTARSSLPPRGESRHEWRVEARDLTRASADSVQAAFTFRAHSSTDRDALELVVPVKPRAVALRPSGAAVLQSERQELSVALPTDLVRPGSEVRLDLSASPGAMALAAANALAEYPWGCAEQTANVIRTATAVLPVFQAGGAHPPGWEDPERKLGPTLARLIALQKPDGGWSWWEEGEFEPYLTVLAVDALSRAALLGIGGETARMAIQRADFAIQRAIGSALTGDGQAYVLAHTTRALGVFEGQAGEAAGPRKFRDPGGATAPSETTMRREGRDRAPSRAAPGATSEQRTRLLDLAALVYASRDRLGTAGLALAARAHADLGRTQEARALLVLLIARAAKERADLHWPAEMDASNWFGEADENTGYALSALLAVDPKDERAEGIVRWLARRRTGRMWRSTRTTAPVAMALAEYLLHHPAELAPDHRLTVQWNGETVLEREVGKAEVFAGRPMTVRLGGGSLKPGDNRLTVAKRGRGVVHLGWEATAMVPSPGPPPSAPAVRITREYLEAERTSDRRGRPQFLTAPGGGGQAFGVGDLVMVRILLTADRPVDYLMVQDPRPAGFEVDALLPEGVERPWNLHAEERDDRVAFFLDRIESGDTVIEYLIRPEIAGRFVALPIEAVPMYDPDRLGRGGEAMLEVRGK